MEVEMKTPIEIDFSEWKIPNEKVKEFAYLPSGRIVVMGNDDSYWFEKDGTNNKDGRISRLIFKI